MTIGDYAFAYTGISVITFNEGSRITGIGADAFAKDDTYDKVDDEKELILPGDPYLCRATVPSPASARSW